VASTALTNSRWHLLLLYFKWLTIHRLVKYSVTKLTQQGAHTMSLKHHRCFMFRLSAGTQTKLLF
jgi:hypothetical protein